MQLHSARRVDKRTFCPVETDTSERAAACVPWSDWRCLRRRYVELGCRRNYAGDLGPSQWTGAAREQQGAAEQRPKRAAGVQDRAAFRESRMEQPFVRVVVWSIQLAG